jgi:phosphopantetheinyl transferase
MTDKTYIKEYFSEVLIHEWLQQLSKMFGFDFDIVDMADLNNRGGLSAGEIDKILSAAEIVSLNKIKLEKNRLQWVAGRYAVKNAFSRYLNSNMDYRSIDVLRGADSAPYIPQFPSHIVSISHSYPYCVGMVAQRKIGVDIEKISMPDKSLIKYFYTENEKHALKNCTSDDRYSGKSMIYWTRKEAVAKLLRLGMKMDFGKLDTSNDLYYENNSVIKMESLECKDFCISIAVQIN